MAKQSIGLGTAADDGTGDNLRAAFDKVNDNFLEIYTLIGDASSLTSGISATATVVTLTAPLITTSISPSSSGGAALGANSLEWSDLFLAGGAVVNFGSSQDVTLTHVANTGILLNSTNQLQFGDSGTHISQSADGVLDLVSDTELELNATTIDINGNVEISGTLTSVGVVTFTATPVFSADVTIEDDLFLDSDAAVLHLGEDGDVTLTHVADTGILLNDSRQLQFGDSGTYIHQSTDGV
tara:strand:+ start:133 stop:852 length:720 start_codon:yes stop_codon:yes gene_type:complete